MKTKKAKIEQDVIDGALQASQETIPWASMDDVEEAAAAEWTSAPVDPKTSGGPSGSV